MIVTTGMLDLAGKQGIDLGVGFIGTGETRGGVKCEGVGGLLGT